MSEKVLAIITARGNSKRIPHKNIREFCGKPIISYSIQAAKESGLFEEVMVSTDSEEIAKISREYGAEIPFMRSAKNSDDYATTADVIMEVVEEYRKRGREYDYVCCIYPTAPFVTGEKLKNAFEALKEKNGNKLIPVVNFSFPPQRGFRITEKGLIERLDEKLYFSRSQDLETYYHDCGQFYFYKTEELLKTGGKIWDKVIPYVLSELEVQDIDTIEDWKMAEIKYQVFNSKTL